MVCEVLSAIPEYLFMALAGLRRKCPCMSAYSSKRTSRCSDDHSQACFASVPKADILTATFEHIANIHKVHQAEIISR